MSRRWGALGGVALLTGIAEMLGLWLGVRMSLEMLVVGGSPALVLWLGQVPRLPRGANAQHAELEQTHLEPV
jgi:hypothetical protein